MANVDDTNMIVEPFEPTQKMDIEKKPVKTDKSAQAAQAKIQEQQMLVETTQSKKRKVEALEESTTPMGPTTETRPLVLVRRTAEKTLPAKPSELHQQTTVFQFSKPLPKPSAPEEGPLKKLKPAEELVQRELNECSQKFKEMINPANPLREFLPQDFKAQMNDLIKKKQIEEAAKLLKKTSQNATRMHQAEIQFEKDVLQAVYDKPDATITEAHRMRQGNNCKGALILLQLAYKETIEQFPPGFSKQIAHLEKEQKFEEAIHLFETSVAVVTHPEIRTSFEEAGKEILKQVLPEEYEKPLTTWDEVKSLLQQVVTLPIRTAFPRRTLSTSVQSTLNATKTSAKGKKSQTKPSSLSAPAMAKLANFLIYCSQNPALNERLKNQQIRDRVDAFLYTFSYKTQLATDEKIQKTKQKLHALFERENIQTIRLMQQQISDHLSSLRGKLGTITATCMQLQKLSPPPLHLIELLQRFPIINPYYDDALPHWLEQVSAATPMGLGPTIHDIVETCMQIQKDVKTIKESLSSLNLKQDEKLSPAEIYQLNSFSRLADFLPKINLPIIKTLKDGANEAITLLETMESLFHAIDPRESGNLILHVEARIREYMGKSKTPSLQELQDIETFYFSVLGKMRHAALTNIEQNGDGNTVVEILEEGYRKSKTNLEDALFANEYIPNFSALIISEQKAKLKQLLHVQTDEQLCEELKARYQMKLHDFIVENDPLLKKIGYTQTAVDTLLYSIANYIDEAVWGKILPRQTPEQELASHDKQLKAGIQTMKCSELVGHLLNESILSVQEDLNVLAGTQGVRYFETILPQMPEGITPARLDEFGQKFCQLKPHENLDKFIRLPNQ